MARAAGTYAVFETSLAISFAGCLTRSSQDDREFHRVGRGHEGICQRQLRQKKKNAITMTVLVFHRVIPQVSDSGGCPPGDGRGGPRLQLLRTSSIHRCAIPSRGKLSMANSAPAPWQPVLHHRCCHAAPGQSPHHLRWVVEAGYRGQMKCPREFHGTRARPVGHPEVAHRTRYRRRLCSLPRASRNHGKLVFCAGTLVVWLGV